MPSLLSSHLEQISLCASSISDLPFQTPRQFSNALLANHDITALIRDTEPHENALFHLANPSSSSSSTASTAKAQYNQQPRNKAVAAVLGKNLYAQTRQEGGNGRKGELDVGVLLEGAERLTAVYPIPGAATRIAELRARQQQLEANVRYYEERVARQTRELERMKGRWDGATEDLGENEEDMVVVTMSKEDLEREEESCRELEAKKRGLEERVEGMERDLGGLMR